MLDDGMDVKMLKAIFTITFIIFWQISQADPFIVIENKLIYDTENSEEATEIAFVMKKNC